MARAAVDLDMSTHVRIQAQSPPNKFQYSIYWSGYTNSSPLLFGNCKFVSSLRPATHTAVLTSAARIFCRGALYYNLACIDCIARHASSEHISTCQMVMFSCSGDKSMRLRKQLYTSKRLLASHTFLLPDQFHQTRTTSRSEFSLFIGFRLPMTDSHVLGGIMMRL